MWGCTNRCAIWHGIGPDSWSHQRRSNMLGTCTYLTLKDKYRTIKKKKSKPHFTLSRPFAALQSHLHVIIITCRRHLVEVMQMQLALICIQRQLTDAHMTTPETRLICLTERETGGHFVWGCAHLETSALHYCDDSSSLGVGLYSALACNWKAAFTAKSVYSSFKCRQIFQ